MIMVGCSHPWALRRAADFAHLGPHAAASAVRPRGNQSVRGE
jgi:hypothetical protein